MWIADESGYKSIVLGFKETEPHQLVKYMICNQFLQTVEKPI